jgi:Zn ribbon nucleic-acid-binding protein
VSENFYLCMREQHKFYVRCAACNNKEDVDIWGGNVCDAEDSLNATLNREGWAMEDDAPLCPDCQKPKRIALAHPNATTVVENGESVGYFHKGNSGYVE